MRNKPSPIYPNLGVYTKVCFAYKLVSGKLGSKTYKMKIRIVSIFIFLILLGCKTISVSEVEKNYLLSDTGKDKYYLIKLIRQKQKEKVLGEMPMLIVNGEPTFYYYRKDNSIPGTSKKFIKKIEILSAEKGVQTFGAAAKYGLILINTYGNQQKLP